MTLSEKIKDAFEKGETSVVFAANYGDVRISRTRNSYTAELLDENMPMSQTANDPMTAICGLKPWVQERRSTRRR